MLEKFRQKSFSYKDVTDNDKGVSVKEVINLIEGSRYYKDLIEVMGIKDIENEFIEISGAQKLLKTITEKNKQFEKIDLNFNFSDLEFTKTTDDGKFAIAFTSIDEETGEILDKDPIVARPIYSAQSDFFATLFNMDRYARSLINKGHDQIIHSNLQYLKDIYSDGTKHKYKYRLLKDQDGYYFRAITSSNRYHDYSNNIAVFVGLVALHHESKATKNRFSIKLCEYSESFIRIFFEKEESRSVENVGRAKYMIEVSNDEVKREALRFSGVMTLIYGDDKPEKGEIFIKPKDLKTVFLSISHGTTPKNAFRALENISNYKEKEAELFADLSKISSIKKPDQIRYLIKSKVEKMNKTNEISKYKRDILKELTNTVDSIYELLKLLKKNELIADEDINAKEYLRYFIYELLIRKE